ncbi:MAG: GNAT family N-acetyltransferase [Pseudomonadales bacterium]|nr:GNAT family N-acetyltransferase [Pseudomonadales bacterium]
MAGRWLSPVTLSGEQVTLEPLERTHIPALAEACADGEIWRHWYTLVAPPDRMGDYVEAALHQQQAQGALPFTVRLRDSGQVVGCTRFFRVDEDNHRMELGHTWYARRVQRTGVNTECKLLLLSHAFESRDAIAVEFRTHWHNRQSRQAIARLGAKQDGVLRNHTRSPEGVYRDTVVFSIINHEWPAVRQNLRYLLERGGQ